MSTSHTVVYQGTFDPFTNGHLSVVSNMLTVFDEVLVLLLVNPQKKPLFSVQERKEMIEAAVTGLHGVRVDSYEGLLVDYMHSHHLTACVRGVRNAADTAYEQENHFLSQAFYPALQTLLWPCEPQWQALSSSAVKAACASGRLPGHWVPSAIAEQLKKRYSGLVIF